MLCKNTSNQEITFNICKQDECYNTSNVSGYITNTGTILTASLSLPENYHYNFTIIFDYGDRTLITEYVTISEYNNVHTN